MPSNPPVAFCPVCNGLIEHDAIEMEPLEGTTEPRYYYQPIGHVHTDEEYQNFWQQRGVPPKVDPPAPPEEPQP